jgi:hypothetical protein
MKERVVPSTFRNGFYAGLIAALFLGLWLTQLWSAEKQVHLHSEHLLRKIEKRNWSAARDFVAPDYHDEWGDDRALLLRRLRLVLRFFSSLTIKAATPLVQLEPPFGVWRARVELAGKDAGAEVTPEIIRRVNGLTTPFELRWHHESWKPWDWKLVEVRNPELDVPAGFD